LVVTAEETEFLSTRCTLVRWLLVKSKKSYLLTFIIITAISAINASITIGSAVGSTAK
jgi:Na+/citrate or Na+/malate symporter